jgi:hypothetical protein
MMSIGAILIKIRMRMIRTGNNANMPASQQMPPTYAAGGNGNKKIINNK